MVCHFSTEPDFQAQFDWVDAFGRDECEPLDVLVERDLFARG